MTVAIPSWQQRISPVLDTAMSLLIVTCRNGRETSRREILLGPLTPDAFTRSVVELRVDVLLCAALSQELQRALEQRGVQVQPHLCGDVNEVLHAFGCGQLNRAVFHMPGCGCGDCCHRSARVGRNQCRSPRPERRPKLKPHSHPTT
jgi:predicted Fe-Mo cluster-binding NifX family protein